MYIKGLNIETVVENSGPQERQGLAVAGLKIVVRTQEYQDLRLSSKLDLGWGQGWSKVQSPTEPEPFLAEVLCFSPSLYCCLVTTPPPPPPPARLNCLWLEAESWVRQT